MAEPTSSGAALVRAMRPRQWLKNLLVLAAPLAAGVLRDGDNAVAVLLTLIAFCFAASATYLCNDVVDVEADRAHPTRRRRPIADDQVSAAAALAVAAVMSIASLALGALVSPAVAYTLAVYLALQAAYSTWLRKIAVVDLVVIACGFLLRAIAGAVAVDVPLSQWFLIVTAFGSLFMVAGKRYSELRTLGPGETRPSLQFYSESYLRFVWSLAAGVTLTAYSLWAFEMSVETVAWQSLSIAPFVIALLRYAVVVDRAEAGEPEDVVLRDPVLLLLGVLWLVILTVGIYAS